MRGSVRGRPGNWPSYRDEVFFVDGKKQGAGEVTLAVGTGTHKVKFGGLNGYEIKSPKKGWMTAKVRKDQTTTVRGVYSASDIKAPATTASPAGGSYTSAQSVILTCLDNAGGSGCSKTYYTTDGSMPTTSSSVYSSPISISSKAYIVASIMV